jgi:hypothetical protein
VEICPRTIRTTFISLMLAFKRQREKPLSFRSLEH